jgi:uncharacterized protein YqgC (DUF456 family)
VPPGVGFSPGCGWQVFEPFTTDLWIWVVVYTAVIACTIVAMDIVDTWWGPNREGGGGAVLC